MKQFESVFSRGLVAAVVCLTAGIAAPCRAEEATQGTGKVTDSSAFRAAPDAGVAVTGAPTGASSDSRSPESSAGRAALNQPQCSICLGGTASAQWTGGTGSFHVDSVTNYGSGTTGQLDLKMVLTASLPVWGQTIFATPFSGTVLLNPLAAGYQYPNVDSGTVPYFGSSIPTGEYFLLMYLRENVSGTWYYDDWIQMNKKVSCNGSGCSTINPSSCTEDTFTMCLVNGRYRVTSHWRNQYAGGATATLSKAKMTDTTGAFWIADANTYEYMIRLQPGQSNGRTWIAIPTFTDVEFWIEVTDTQGQGQSKEYHSDAGNRTLIYDPYFFVYP